MRVRNLCLVIVPTVLLVIVLAVPTLRWGAWGLLCREPFADGAPISYWTYQFEYGDAAERERALRSLDRIEGDAWVNDQKLTWFSIALNEYNQNNSLLVRQLAAESLGRMTHTGWSAVPGRW